MHCFQQLREDIRGLEPLLEDDVERSDLDLRWNVALQHLYTRKVVEQDDTSSGPTPPDVSQPDQQRSCSELEHTALQATVQTTRSTKGLARQDGQASRSASTPSNGVGCQQLRLAPTGCDRLVAAGLQQEGSSSDAGECNGVAALATLRAKNRRAQQKCRERQKQKLAESEARTRDLERSLERLKLLHLALEARAALLESLVGLREDGNPQQQLLLPDPDEAAGQWECQTADSCVRGHAVRGCSGEKRCHTVNGATHGRQPHSTAEYGGQAGGLMDCFTHPILHEDVQELVEDLGCDEDDSMLDLRNLQDGVVCLTVYQGRPRQAGTPETIFLTQDQLSSLPLGELAVLWSEYVGALAPLLKGARADVASPAGHRAVQLAGEVRLLVSSLMSANQKGWCTLRAMQMDPDGGVPLMAQPPAGWWHKVYRAMSLSLRQRRQAMAYRDRMLARMGAILRARRELLKQCSQQQPLPDHIMLDPQGGIAVAQGLLAASDAAEALRANIAEEELLHNQFLCCVRSVLEPLQCAIAIVHSYPWCPEALAITNCCAGEDGASTAHDLLL